MRRKRNTDHVVSDAKDHGAFKCLHCGARHAVKLPAPIPEFVKAGKAFTTLHAGCKPTEGSHGR